MQTGKYRDALMDRIVEPMATSLSLLGDEPAARVSSMREWIAEYFDLIPGCPVRQFLGGGGWNAGLHLFCIARAIEPSTIIESGTFKGFSSWVFRQASPQSEIHCFDVDLSKRQWRAPSIVYHEYDWSDATIAMNEPKRAFAYFDDHVSQARRIIEAARLGITLVGFDDNLPVEGLFVDGTPAAPTVDMILDERLRDGDMVEWYTDGRVRSYVHDGTTIVDARRKIGRVIRLPDLNFYRRCSTTVVQLDPRHG